MSTVKDRSLKVVEYRKPGPRPSKPGWYYVRLYGEIVIWPMIVGRNKRGVLTPPPIMGCISMDDFDWFGPVPEVREG